MSELSLDQQLRIEALRLANARGYDQPVECIVYRAEKYYAFLSGAAQAEPNLPPDGSEPPINAQNEASA